MSKPIPESSTSALNGGPNSLQRLPIRRRVSSGFIGPSYCNNMRSEVKTQSSKEAVDMHSSKERVMLNSQRNMLTGADFNNICHKDELNAEAKERIVNKDLDSLYCAGKEWNRRVEDAYNLQPYLLSEGSFETTLQYVKSRSHDSGIEGICESIEKSLCAEYESMESTSRYERRSHDSGIEGISESDVEHAEHTSESTSWYARRSHDSGIEGISESDVKDAEHTSESTSRYARRSHDSGIEGTSESIEKSLCAEYESMEDTSNHSLSFSEYSCDDSDFEDTSESYLEDTNDASESRSLCPARLYYSEIEGIDESEGADDTSEYTLQCSVTSYDFDREDIPESIEELSNVEDNPDQTMSFSESSYHDSEYEYRSESEWETQSVGESEDDFEIPDSDLAYPKDSKVKYSEAKNPLTVKIINSLNPKIEAVNCRVRKHNLLMKLIDDSFNQIFKEDEYLHAKAEKSDYLFPKELLTAPNLELDKLKKLSFDYRVWLITVRSLIQKMNKYKQKCDARQAEILGSIRREVKMPSSTDMTIFSQKLSRELGDMQSLLDKFCLYADLCNSHQEKLLMDEKLMKGGLFSLK